VLTLRDVSERKRLEEQLLHRALHDPLTGLANRALFADRLRHAHALARESGRRYAVAVADLDDFKAINDGFGHASGDQALREIATAIQQRLRGPDLAARIGGDEFGVLLPQTGREAAEAVARDLEDAVCRALTPPLATTASIGISTL